MVQPFLSFCLPVCHTKAAFLAIVFRMYAEENNTEDEGDDDGEDDGEEKTAKKVSPDLRKQRLCEREGLALDPDFGSLKAAVTGVSTLQYI